VAQVIGAELCLKAVRCMAKRSCHYSCIRDDHIERLTLCHQSISAGAHALEVRKIKLYQLEASAVARSVLLHLCGCRFRLAQIPRGAHNLRAMRRKGTGGFDPEPGRDAGYQNPFASEIDPGQNIFCG
jgi:hypothetical protein